jgi:5-methylcytosine-specific restriction endonuclease McrBC GTP-binding regulatory subunit McrB
MDMKQVGKWNGDLKFPQNLLVMKREGEDQHLTFKGDTELWFRD